MNGVICSDFANIIDLYATGRYSLGVIILSTAPIAKSHNLSQVETVFEDQGVEGAVLMLAASLVQENSFCIKITFILRFFSISALRGAISSLQLGMIFLTKAKIPKKDWLC